MTTTHALNRSLAITFAFAIAGCTTASIESSWHEPSPPVLTNVVTLSPAPDGALRRNIEDKMAQQLAGHGVRATPAYAVLSDEDLQDQNRIAAVLHTAGYDGVVTIRMVGAQQQLSYYPSFYSYWGDAWGSVVATTVVRVQVNAYSLPDDKLVWSALSKSVDPDSTNELIGDVTKLTSERLAQQRVVGAPQISQR